MTTRTVETIQSALIANLERQIKALKGIVDTQKEIIAIQNKRIENLDLIVRLKANS